MQDQATRLMAIRHGQTEWNALGRMQGHTDIALNHTGRMQARWLARALADEPIDLIVSSDLQRAQHTAQAVAEVTGAALQLDSGLRERGFGIWEGLTYSEVEAQYPAQAQQWRQRDPDAQPLGGESLRQFYERCVASAGRWASAHVGQSVVLVAHGGVLDCLYRAATGLDLQAARTWQLGNATINRLLWTPQGFGLVGWNDERHLNPQDPSAQGLD